MSEQDRQSEIAFIESAKGLPEEVVLEDSFWALDASLAMLLVYSDYGKQLQESGVQIARLPTTTTFILWQIRDTEGNGYGAISLRMIDERHTHVSAQPGPYILSASGLNRALVVAMLLHVLNAFLRFRQEDLDRMEALAKKTGALAGGTVKEAPLGVLRFLSPPKRPRGSPGEADNNWAREAIERGENKDVVFNEYLRRQKVDINDKASVALARDRFNKAIRRQRGRK